MSATAGTRSVRNPRSRRNAPPTARLRARAAFAAGRLRAPPRPRDGPPCRRLDERPAGSRCATPPLPSCAVERVRLEDRPSFITADGSSIRELAGVPSGNSVNQSLAEATVPPGGETVEHFHRSSEEIYLFTAGAGRMRLGDEEAEVRAGDTRRDRARNPAQAVESRRGATRAAVLLRPALFGQRHRPAVRTALALLVQCFCSRRPAAHAAPPKIGIGEQHAKVFSDPYFQQLGVREVRYIASWDALRSASQRAEIDTYLKAAGAAGVRVLLGFGHCARPRQGARPAVGEGVRARGGRVPRALSVDDRRT